MINKCLSKTKAIPILSIALALNLGPLAAAQEYKRQSSLRFCQPRTRCTEYEICYINDIAQPCAWGRGGAALSAVFFEHGTFHLEWLSEDDIQVIYGDKKQYKASATLVLKDGYRIFKLSDGVTFRLPDWTIPLHLVGEEIFP